METSLSLVRATAVPAATASRGRLSTPRRAATPIQLPCSNNNNVRLSSVLYSGSRALLRGSSNGAVKLVSCRRGVVAAPRASVTPATSRAAASPSTKTVTRRGDLLVPCAVTASGGDGDPSAINGKPDSILGNLRSIVRVEGKTVLLGALFAGWYGANIVFNIYNKQTLVAHPFPLTSTLCQFAVGSVLVVAMWASGAYKPPKKMDAKMLLPIVPLAVVHTLGNVLTNVSLGKVAVSFTHTIKAMEPLFSVVLSSMFLGDVPSAAVVLTLVPIVGGVAMASMTEMSFNWTGFLAAMGSNLTFQLRNVMSKKRMKAGGPGDAKESIGNINLFSIITLMSLVGRHRHHTCSAA